MIATPTASRWWSHVDGSTANGSLDVAINDDVPSAVNDSNSVTEDAR
ncbi:hypothetical protein [Gallaecimonas pentaromativorans]